MTIYAIFLCFAMQGCQYVPASSVSSIDYDGQQVFTSLQDCRHTLLSLTGGKPLARDGSYDMGGGNQYICLSRHVDTWSESQ